MFLSADADLRNGMLRLDVPQESFARFDALLLQRFEHFHCNERIAADSATHAVNGFADVLDCIPMHRRQPLALFARHQNDAVSVLTEQVRVETLYAWPFGATKCAACAARPTGFAFPSGIT